MITNEFREACSEIIEILKYFDKKRIEKIPKEIMEIFYENQALNYETKIDISKPLEEQNMKQETKDILVSLYVEYLCPEEEEKEEINKILNKNYIKEQNRLRQKYNTDDLFKNKIENKKQLELIQDNEKIFVKIIKKIKQILKIK